jgi:divalent metal cation (Fe/Co/Zn/Cd) transporter
MHFGPEQILVAFDVQFREHLSAEELEAAIDRLEETIRAKHPRIKHIFMEADSISIAAERGRPARKRKASTTETRPEEPHG